LLPANSAASSGPSSAKTRRPEGPPALTRSLFYDILSTAVTMVFVNFCGSTFFLLDHKLGLQLWHSLYYFGLWVPMFVLVLAKLPLFKDKKKKSE
jgi:hypothetical protein